MLPARQPSDRLDNLTVQGLTYLYPNSPNGIQNFDLELSAGSFTVITGQIGAGKTTLLKALLGVLPIQSGQVCWNGETVSELKDFFVPPRSAYTPQVPR